MRADSLTDNLRRAAERWPDRCAVKEGATELAYAELWHRARLLANALIERGLETGDRVAIALPNSADYVVALYAVLLAGGIAVPLNSAAKNRDFSTWIRHCEPRIVFASAVNAELADALAQAETSCSVVWVGDDRDDLESLLSSATASTALPECTSDQPAMIIYTSGTTGEPKGVTLSHGNLASNTEAIVESLRLREHDKIVNVLPFYFSYGNSVLHTHVKVGGCIVLEPNFIYPHAVVERLQSERATGFAGVPSTYALMLSRVKLDGYDLSSLRYLTQAGGAMPQALARRLGEVLPHVQLYMMYGQTEATARITCLAPEHATAKAGSVGRPIGGVRVQVRREDGAIAAVNESGELWVSGPGVMLGYWRNPKASEMVIRDGWLRTGDVGRVDADGFVYLEGRRSDMIKSGANRIHPQDIEEVIAEMPGVQEVAAVGIDDEILGQAIKVFVVPQTNAQLTPMQIQAHCRARLASYKIPKYVEMVPVLPKTASGKVRRAELAKQQVTA